MDSSVPRSASDGELWERQVALQAEAAAVGVRTTHQFAAWLSEHGHPET